MSHRPPAQISARIWNDTWRGAARDTQANRTLDECACERCGATARTTNIRRIPDAQQILHRFCWPCLQTGLAQMAQAVAKGQAADEARRLAWRWLGYEYETGEPVKEEQ